MSIENIQKFQCEYCQNTFKDKYKLKYHQKSAKYCLEIQGIKKKPFKCLYCEHTSTSRSSLKVHYASCKQKYVKDKVHEIQSQHEKEITRLEYEKKLELQELRTVMLEQQLENVNNFKDQLMKEALKPKITNNTSNNLTMNMRTEYMQENIKPFYHVIPNIEPTLKQKFNHKHLLSGVSDCATFIKDELLTNSDGDVYYMTIEKDKNFYYKDEKNNIQMDDNGSMIKTYVLPKMIYRCKEVFYTRRNELTNYGVNDNFPEVKPLQQAIIKFKD